MDVESYVAPVSPHSEPIVAEKEYSFTYTGAFGDRFQALPCSLDNVAEIGSATPKETWPATSRERVTKAPSVVVASGPSFSYSGEHSLTAQEPNKSSSWEKLRSASISDLVSPPAVSSPTSGAPSYRDVLLMKSTRETSRPPQPRPTSKSPSSAVVKPAGIKAAVMSSESSESSDAAQEHVVKAASVVIAAGPSFTYSGASRVVQKTCVSRPSSPPLIEDITEKSGETGTGPTVPHAVVSPTLASSTIQAPADTEDSSDEEESSQSSSTDEIDIKPPSVVVATGPSFTYNGGSQVIKKPTTHNARAHRVEDVTESLDEDVYGRSLVPVTTDSAVVTDMDNVDEESSVSSNSSDEIDIKPPSVVVATGPSFTYNGSSQVIKKPTTQTRAEAHRVEDVIETLHKDDAATIHAAVIQPADSRIVLDDDSDAQSESSSDGVIWAAPALTDRSNRPALDESTSVVKSIADLSTTV
ncbi:MAG: uncharacterized protein KVP18_002088, partial [Porospora cf. gigantea A]|uniref:uncharacterized protein n=1 Tax=Porospora cf. gigantea A TaxID=2853593 RepID=UPI00355A9D7E